MELTGKEKSQYEQSLMDAGIDSSVTTTVAGEIDDTSLREWKTRREEPVETDFSGRCNEVQKMHDVVYAESSRNLRYSAVYRITRPFSIKRIGRYYKNPANKIQEYAKSQEQSHGIYTTVLQLKKMCEAAYLDLAVTINN